MQAKACFEQALVIALSYASAYSGLAGYYFTLAVVGIRPWTEVSPLARSAAEKALAIDPANSEAHSLLAILAGALVFDWKVSEKHHGLALAEDPVPPTNQSPLCRLSSDRAQASC